MFEGESVSARDPGDEPTISCRESVFRLTGRALGLRLSRGLSGGRPPHAKIFSCRATPIARTISEALNTPTISRPLKTARCLTFARFMSRAA